MSTLNVKIWANGLKIRMQCCFIHIVARLGAAMFELAVYLCIFWSDLLGK